MVDSRSRAYPTARQPAKIGAARHCGGVTPFFPDDAIGVFCVVVLTGAAYRIPKVRNRANHTQKSAAFPPTPDRTHRDAPASAGRHCFLISYPEPGVRGRRRAHRVCCGGNPRGEAEPPQSRPCARFHSSRATGRRAGDVAQRRRSARRPVVVSRARIFLEGMWSERSGDRIHSRRSDFRKSKMRQISALFTVVHRCSIRRCDSLRFLARGNASAEKEKRECVSLWERGG